jgi:hypothetical protein
MGIALQQTYHQPRTTRTTPQRPVGQLKCKVILIWEINEGITSQHSNLRKFLSDTNLAPRQQTLPAASYVQPIKNEATTASGYTAFFCRPIDIRPSWQLFRQMHKITFSRQYPDPPNTLKTYGLEQHTGPGSKIHFSIKQLNATSPSFDDIDTKLIESLLQAGKRHYTSLSSMAP